MRFAQRWMYSDFSRIWEWLYGQSEPLEEPALAEPDPPRQPDAAAHSIDDVTLLALELEAEVVGKLQAACEPDPVHG